jgi:chromosome segregation ATPase
MQYRWYERLLGWLGTRQLVPRASLPALRAELEEHLRNAEAALADKRRDLAQLEDRRHSLEIEHQRLEENHRRLDRDVQLALVESQDRLARFALCRALALRHKLDRVSNELRGMEYRCEQLAELVARQQADWVALRKDAAGAQGSRDEIHGQRPLDPISQEEVELELLRRKRRLAQHGSKQKEVADAGSEF